MTVLPSPRPVRAPALRSDTALASVPTLLCAPRASTLPLLAALLLSGCAGRLRAASAGEIGCAPDDVVISDDHTGWGTRTWKATCHGEVFQCSAVSTGSDNEHVSCAKEVVEGSAGGAQPAAPAAAPAATSEVGREFNPATQETSVRGSFQLEGGQRAVLIVAPRSAPGRLAVVIAGPSDGPLDQCRQLNMLVNARPFAAFEVQAQQREVGSFQLSAGLHEAELQGLDKPHAEFALQACERTWKFSAAQVEDLKKLLTIAGDLAQQQAAPAAVPATP
jgi:hypothetical protein